jgi:hypothetical protein
MVSGHKLASIDVIRIEYRQHQVNTERTFSAEIEASR